MLVARCSLLVALDAIGVGETAGRKALKRGDLPFRVIKVGGALRVPTCDLSILLAPATPDSSEAGASTPAIALADSTATTTQEP